MSIVMAATAAGLFAIGTYLVLQHTLTRIIIGLALISHGGNVLLLAAGERGVPPIVGADDSGARVADPVAQALALTTIVITFAVSAFLLALAYRSWVVTRDDEVQDDVADRFIARHGHLDKEIVDEEAPVDDDPEGVLEVGGP